MSIAICVTRLPHGEGLDLPSYATAGADGMDLLAAVTDPVTIAPGKRALIPTGLAIALPPGYELQIRPRSEHNPAAPSEYQTRHRPTGCRNRASNSCAMLSS